MTNVRRTSFAGRARLRRGQITRGETTTKIACLFALGCAMLALAGAAQGALSIGVSEDRGRDNPATFFASLTNIGLSQNRVSIFWDPRSPDVISGKTALEALLPMAQTAGVRVVFAISPKTPRALTASPSAPSEFAAFVAQVAKAFPQVKNYVIGNEPNQPVFWLPQYDPAGTPVSAAAYETVLAKSYDALKTVDPTITVIGLGLSPRGNDNPNAKSNVSRSPVRFMHELGQAYRTSGRTKPLMDELAFHPYPVKNTDPPFVGYTWPNAGLANLDRIKQAVWDAFHGTAQPTFAETGVQSFTPPLKLELDEIGWQVAIMPSLANLYSGTETIPTIDEATQAGYYADAITAAECDPTVSSLSFFLLLDEPLLSRWQSGLERIDGSHRPSYNTVKQVIADTDGNCRDSLVGWTHAAGIVAPRVLFGDLRRKRTTRTTKWSFKAGAKEEAVFRAGIFPAGTTKRTIASRLVRSNPKALMSSAGVIKAKNRVVAFPKRKLKKGRYVFAIRMQARMNPSRVTVVVSSAFRVSASR
jgi:hypothetical protein